MFTMQCSLSSLNRSLSEVIISGRYRRQADDTLSDYVQIHHFSRHYFSKQAFCSHAKQLLFGTIKS